MAAYPPAGKYPQFFRQGVDTLRTIRVDFLWRLGIFGAGSVFGMKFCLIRMGGEALLPEIHNRMNACNSADSNW